MSTVMIKCPETGKAVSTGFAMDKRTFENATMSNNSVHCPACGKDHTWEKKDAWLEEA
jgi:endogenous inhibitor of DNA gyrase (YacG/DUF329 family)